MGRWEGNTLVVESVGFVEETWFGEGGYFHSDAMRVTERFWRSGENLAYQVTVDDPKVLTAPWTMPARLVKPSTEPLEESPHCVEQDGKLLQNDESPRPAISLRSVGGGWQRGHQYVSLASRPVFFAWIGVPHFLQGFPPRP